MSFRGVRPQSAESPEHESKQCRVIYYERESYALPVEEKKTGNGSDWITILNPSYIQGFMLDQTQANLRILKKQPQA